MNATIGNGQNTELLPLLATFSAVISQGSLAAAARALAVPKSTISRRIERLEQALAMALFVRDGRRLVPTREATLLHEQAQPQLLRLFDSLQQARGRHAEMAGPIRITAPVDLGTIVMAPALATFAREHPQVQLEIDFSNEVLNVATANYDIAMRAGAAAHSNTRDWLSRHLGDSLLVVAMRDDDAAHITVPRDLEQQSWVAFARGEQTLRFANESLRLKARHVVCDYMAMSAFIATFGGFGILPIPHVRGDRGLSRVLPEHAWNAGPVRLLYPSRRLPTRVTALVDHLQRECSPSFSPSPDLVAQ